MVEPQSHDDWKKPAKLVGGPFTPILSVTSLSEHHNPIKSSALLLRTTGSCRNMGGTGVVRFLAQTAVDRSLLAQTEREQATVTPPKGRCVPQHSTAREQLSKKKRSVVWGNTAQQATACRTEQA
ncbi:hypothetical protein AAFF_G00206300 [Aldrovandia affinis]|uniref:Uncharacterized protein n=1 Tax=Aldrovandia affinis TaxID=143900 RepID=A0AAD7RHV3_9TELE|nr:hypothetical protein AAFF_G00206300 [Aldrovandia affinis]